MKTQSARFLFLGTGGSMGVPVIGCTCEVCRSDSPFNKRLRSSGLITVANKRILLDAGPDLRQQALRENIDTIDGVIFTHAHHDHSGGVDDLRIYSLRNQTPLPCLMSKATSRELEMRYSYIFETNRTSSSLITKMDIVNLDGVRGAVKFLGLDIKYVSFEQAGMLVNGFRFGNLAYISDISHYSNSIIEDLQGIEYLIVSALRFGDSQIHFTVDEAIDFTRKIAPKQTWFMHTAHELDYDETNAYLPADIRMAYDGLEIEFLAEIEEE